MLKSTITVVIICAMTMLSQGAANALDARAQKQFSRYMDMTMAELTDAAEKKLTEKYPHEDWSSWNFPDYVNADKTIETSYRIAVKEPRLLGLANLNDKKQVIPCYCSCKSFGHANLLHCFLKDGKLDDEFDEHGSQCGVCMRQAFLAFLWSGLGASHQDIIKGMEQKFAPLIERHQGTRVSPWNGRSSYDFLLAFVNNTSNN
jgi:hypothetical protein